MSFLSSVDFFTQVTPEIHSTEIFSEFSFGIPTHNFDFEFFGVTSTSFGNLAGPAIADSSKRSIVVNDSQDASHVTSTTMNLTSRRKQSSA